MQDQNSIEEEFQNTLERASYGRDIPLLAYFAHTDHPVKQSLDRFKKMQENLDYTKLYEELQKFTKCYYSAHRIKLVIQASLPVDTLEKYVTMYTRFVNIPTNNILSPDDFTECKHFPFDTAAFGKKFLSCYYDNQVLITWALPAQLDLCKSKSYQYVSSFIEQKGEGSLFSYLSQKMWINAFRDDRLHCIVQHHITFSIFRIIIEISLEGTLKTYEILEALFSYINLLKKVGPQKRIYDEISAFAENSFRHTDEKNPVDNVKTLCENMFLYPPRDYIRGSVTFGEYNPENINKFLNCLVPEEANIMYCKENFHEHEIDYYSWDTYKFDPPVMMIEKHRMEHWKSVEPLPDFHLPLKNICVPIKDSSISIPADVAKHPVKLHSDHKSEIWYLPADKFCLPKSHININFISPKILQSPDEALFMTIFCEIIKELVWKELYPAVMAGDNYEFSVSDTGIVLKISASRPILLFLTIVQYMKFRLRNAAMHTFDTVKQIQINIYSNNDTYNEPEILAKDVSLGIYKLVHYTYTDIQNVLQHIHYLDFRDFATGFMSHMYIQCLAQGNITEDAVIKAIQYCVETVNDEAFNYDSLHTRSTMRQQIIDTQIPFGTSYFKLQNLDKRDPRSLVMNTYQVDVISVELSVLMSVINMIMKEQLFLKWQSDDQIRYASCNCTDINGILLYSITVHTLVHTCTTHHIDQWIDEFLECFQTFLDEFSDKDLDDIKERIKLLKQRADMNSAEEVDRNWNEIVNCLYVFDRPEKEILALDEIKINDLREWFAKYILNENTIKKLSVHVE
ncbi:Nardilysin [Cyphomyrmex costatus]|uniref:Nardilysin n=1 Tax=Cyphomyrmex costatus TaxID=456900 RepID=A0A195CD21_9HYME|nr:Nardilysin [Cyphomyrmex costatus]